MHIALHLPCWAHLLNQIAAILFDRKCLFVVVEYVRLTKLTCPFWRTHSIEHQEKYAKTVEAAQKDEKTAGDKVCQVYRYIFRTHTLVADAYSEPTACKSKGFPI